MKSTLTKDHFRKGISLVLFAVFLLTACAGEANQTGTPSAQVGAPVLNTPSSSPEPPQSPAAETATNSPDNPNQIIPLTGDLNPARLSNLMSFAVLRQDGQQIGQVYDIVMDLDASRVAYVLVKIGGLLNVEERQVLVPWRALQVKTTAGNNVPASGSFVLAVDERLFLNAPSFDLTSQLPTVGEAIQGWDKEIRAYWNLPEDAATPPPGSGTSQAPTPEGMPLKGVLLGSEALGFNFRLQGDEALNVSIDDMIINIQTGKILYMVIHTNFENAREQWTPVPYSLLGWDPPSRSYVLNVDKVTLQSAPFYIDSKYPDTTRPGWDDTYVYFWKQYGLADRP